MAAGSKQVTQAKVDYLDITRLANEDVFNLEVSVNDTVSVAVVKGARDLTTKLAGLLLLELAVRNNVVEHLAAIYIFEQHVPVVIGADDIAHAADVGVA